MITITAAAAAQIRTAADNAGADELALRVAARRDERTGEIEYGMGFDSERDHDEECIATGVRVLVSPHSREALEGLTIDYVELTPGEFSFIFVPAEQPSGGGCGSGGCSRGGCGGGSGNCN